MGKMTIKSHYIDTTTLYRPLDNHVQNKTSFTQVPLFSNTWPERAEYIVNHKYFVHWVSVCTVNVILTSPQFLCR